MAFGTWLKQTFNKVKDVAMNKVLPAAKKVAGFVSKAAAPIMGAVGGVIGGTTGDMLSGVGQKVSRIMGGLEKRIPGSGTLQSKGSTGVGGGGIQLRLK